MANPIAVASVTPTAQPLTVSYVGSGSTDTDQDFWTLDFYWNMGDGTVETDMNGFHEYSVPGVYFVTLVVVDSTGLQDFDIKVVSV